MWLWRIIIPAATAYIVYGPTTLLDIPVSVFIHGYTLMTWHLGTVVKVVVVLGHQIDVVKVVTVVSAIEFFRLRETDVEKQSSVEGICVSLRTTK